MKRFLVAAVLASTMFGAAAVLAPGALAHSELVSSDPADGAVLEAPPTTVTFTFNEDLLPDFVRLIATGPSGNTGDLIVNSVEGPSARADWPAGAEAGEWTVSYRVVSLDGHPIEGGITFAYVDPAPTSPSPEPTSALPTPEPISESTSAPTPIASPTASPASDTSSAGPSLLGIAAIVVVILGAVGVVIALLARRRS